MDDYDYEHLTSKEQQKLREEQIVQSYRQDEDMMILVFAQWCVNRGFDAKELYQTAYPDQVDNPRLQQGINLTVPKEEAGDIPDDTLFGVLSMYGNEDLALVISEAIETKASTERRLASQEKEEE